MRLRRQGEREGKEKNLFPCLMTFEKSEKQIRVKIVFTRSRLCRVR